jgi:hypothetical protein
MQGHRESLHLTEKTRKFSEGESDFEHHGLHDTE